MQRLVAFVFLLSLGAGSLFAQFHTGSIFGTVVDQNGGAIPAATVTLTGIGAPRTFVTDDAGRFRFLDLSPGYYDIGAEHSRFGSSVRAGVEVNVSASSNVPITLSPVIDEIVTTTAETPLLDSRKTSTGATLTKVELQQIPTARDPWAVLQQVPAVLVDRINIGGNESGRQSSFIGKGASGEQTTWNVDGVNITDNASAGSSPASYDFDSFEELQVTTSSSDPRVRTPGVQLNLVTKRGTNEWSGSGRYFATDNNWQADADVPREAHDYLARSSEIDHIDDYGVEVGGPIVRDRLWIWGSYAESEIDLLTAVHLVDGVPSGGSFDQTTLENFNAKLNAQIVSNNNATFLWTNCEKVNLGGNGEPLRHLGSRWNQSGTIDLFKFEDTHIIGQSFYLTGLISRVESAFRFDPQKSVDFDADDIAHVSDDEYSSDRPQNNYRLDASSFFDSGAVSHEVKFGFGYRETSSSTTPWQGSAHLTSAGRASFETKSTDLYVGDTMSWGKLTINAALRFDVQAGENGGSAAAANRIVPELRLASLNNEDAKDLEWRSLTPRVGASYALGSTNRTLLRGAYNRYVDQMSGGAISAGHPSSASPVATRLDYDMKAPTTDEWIVGAEHALLPEFTVGFHYTHRQFNDLLWSVYEREQGSGDFYTSADYALGENVITGTLPNGRTYSRRPSVLADGSDPIFSVVTNRPDYKQRYDGLELNLTKRLSNGWLARANVSWNDSTQEVGVEGRGSYDRLSGSYLSGDPTSTLTPDGCSNCDGGMVAHGSRSRYGMGEVYINSKWSYSFAGLYQLPWQITASAALFGRDGHPMPYYVRSGNRDLLIDGVDPQRLDDIINLDLRVAREFRFPAGFGLIVSADVFNVTNERTIVQRQYRQFCRGDICGFDSGEKIGTTNDIIELQSPRVARLGARVTF